MSVTRPTIPALVEKDFRVKDDQCIIAVNVRVEHFKQLCRFRGMEVDLVLAQSEIPNADAVADEQAEFPDDEEDGEDEDAA